ncbi:MULTISPECIES: cysteine dioxygenase family protein [Sphingobium]|uniref:Cysteine dioxygenase n=1 Tax=Sphingobium chungbukense TaxID=56193 RepID=A0A0M3ATR6_9SPHN|nr:MULTISPECIES: cysteine dioxygenase [Sphingobium]KKW91939.1 cysteine dioxygenase [Sphingobium chungbukense]PJG46138.1 cysteine dioxygenase [Sphingobium sp. LB126]
MNAVATISRPADGAADIARLRGFVTAFADLVAATRDEGAILESGRALLSRLIARDDWLPEQFTRPHPERYQQYLLHCDSRERFSVVSFVWGPGQSTPVHDHTVWGLVGILRGVEKVERFRRSPDGRLIAHGEQYLREGEVDAVSPRIGDIHRVTNGLVDRPSISIHVYGANIGAVERATYAADGTAKSFISGYANGVIPNLWDRSRNA